MKIISIETLTELIDRHGLDAFLRDLMSALRRDFSRWDEFTKMPRPAMHVPGGAIELMPICDQRYYSYKYVGGAFPASPAQGKLSVIATGQLSRTSDGYPVMACEMTLLTALRTAATTALATDLMARADARTAAIIGTGAQSEFQIQGLRLVRDLTTVRFYDIDPAAMDKFERNLTHSGLNLIRCQNATQAVRGADIITVCTACKAHVDVIKDAWIKPGVHINGLGGDCPGKTELELSILSRARTVVEYFDQSIIEGEIQRLTKAQARRRIVGELHELVAGTKSGRIKTSDITLFDSVGIALEDYSALRLTYELSHSYGLGSKINLTPAIANPKDLMAVLRRPAVIYT